MANNQMVYSTIQEAWIEWLACEKEHRVFKCDVIKVAQWHDSLVEFQSKSDALFETNIEDDQLLAQHRCVFVIYLATLLAQGGIRFE
jgi:hypothetical protein